MSEPKESADALKISILDYNVLLLLSKLFYQTCKAKCFNRYAKAVLLKPWAAGLQWGHQIFVGCIYFVLRIIYENIHICEENKKIKHH